MMMKRHTLSLALVVTAVIGSAFGCDQVPASPNARFANGALANQRRNVQSPVEAANVSVNSVGFYAWWWSQEQLEAGVYRQETLPPRNTYTRLESWRDTGDADVLHPDLIDVVCKVENVGTQPANLLVSAVVDFKVAPFDVFEGNSSDKPINELLEKSPWAAEQHLGQITVENLMPGESREMQFKDFNLKAILENYSDAKNSTVWPWFLRARIVVKTSGNMDAARGEAGLNIIPGH